MACFTNTLITKIFNLCFFFLLLYPFFSQQSSKILILQSNDTCLMTEGQLTNLTI
jgi:hypothetical protein